MNVKIVNTDYGKHHRLTIMPKEKRAILDDTINMFSVDETTGALKPEELDTDARDKVLKITAQAVQDLGTTKLNGKTVRMLQSQGKETVRTVYVDPQTRQPVQITIEWPKMKRVKYTYADIRIDAPLDDKLFSL